MPDRIKRFTSRVSSLKSQVRGPSPLEEGSPNWGQWAGKKLKRITRKDIRASNEKLYLFPGCAIRRYRDKSAPIKDDSPFDIEILVHGWAFSHNSPETMTRSQRAFVRLAKRYASLPKLPTVVTNASNNIDIPILELSEEHKVPLQTPSALLPVTQEDEDIAAMEKLVYDAKASDPDPLPASLGPFPIPLTAQHSNLETRILPFWSSVLVNRAVRLSLYSGDPDSVQGSQNDTTEAGGAVMVQQTSTAKDGSFAMKTIIPWETLRMHQHGISIAQGGAQQEHELFVRAELLGAFSPSPANQSSNIAVPRDPLPTVAHTTANISLSHSPIRLLSDIDDTIKSSDLPSGPRNAFYNVFVKPLEQVIITEMAEWYNSMWQHGVRFHYVSNGPYELLPIITDFLKLSRLPAGSLTLRSYVGRKLFGGIMSAPMQRKRVNVEDVLTHFSASKFILVGDSGDQDLELYAQIACERPTQIVAVFIRDVHAEDVKTPPLEDPTGSKPKEPTTQPKPFRLVNTVSSRRHRRTTSPVHQAASDPPQQTGAITQNPDPVLSSILQPPTIELDDRCSSTSLGLVVVSHPAISDDESAEDREQFEGNSDQSSSASHLIAPSASPPPAVPAERPTMTEGERRKWDLQQRVKRARGLIPQHIPLRVFRDPSECVEANEIISQLQANISR